MHDGVNVSMCSYRENQLNAAPPYIQLVAVIRTKREVNLNPKEGWEIWILKPLPMDGKGLKAK